MADAPGERELEENLLEAGNKLLEPPAPVDDLLPLLDVSSPLIFFFHFVLFSLIELCTTA